MKKILLSTGNDYGALLLRLFLFIVLFPHGAQKLLGWFGGFGFNNTMNYFTDQAGLPWLLGFIVILIEFFGPLALLAGFATRIWAFAILTVMAGIIITVHNQYFFMNWFGNQATEGAEYFLLAIGMSAALLISGGGSYSLDMALTKKK